MRLLPTPAGYPQTALLGTGTLRHFAVTLDQANRRVRLARGDPVVPAEPPLRRARKFQYACATAAARTRAQLSACVTAAC